MKNIVLVVVFMLVASQVMAATYWVSPSGSDFNGCTNSSTPIALSASKQTIANALTCMSGGDTVYMRGGIYNEPSPVTHTAIPQGGGSWATASKLLCYTGETCTLNPSTGDFSGAGVALGYSNSWIIIGGAEDTRYGLVIDGSKLGDSGNGVRVYQAGASHLRLQNTEVKNVIQASSCVAIGSTGNDDTQAIHNKIHDCGKRPTNDKSNLGGHGIYFNNNNVTIQNNEIYNIGCDAIGIAAGCVTGMGIHGNPGPTSGAIISGNFVHDTYTSGIYTASATNAQIFNNVVARANTAGDPLTTSIGGIRLEGNTNTLLYSNTVYNTSSYGIIFLNGSGSIARNNLIYLNGNNDVPFNSAGASLSNNAIGINPQFTNGSGSFNLVTDFKLTASTPNTINNAGANLTSQGSQFTVDIAGVARPATGPWDIGAYEFAAPVSTVVVNITLPASNPATVNATPLNPFSGTAVSQ